MGTRQRLVYTDSNGDLQVIAERRGALGKADRMIHMRRAVGFDYGKVHGSNQLFGDIPIGVSNFEASEPEIFLQDYQQGSWVDFARIWASNGAEIQKEGKTVVKFWGFDKYIGDKTVNIQNINGTVIDVMQAGLDSLPTDSNYVLDYPTDVTHPSVTNYTNTGKFNKTFQDMFDKYGYAIDVLPETDANGNYKVRFEPIGYGGAVDDIKTAEGDVIQRWNNNDTGKIVNSVTVVGKDSNGAKIEETVTDQASIDEYGEHVHPQNPIHVDYPITSSEASEIGQRYIETDPVSHGRARANLYESNVFNDSVRVVDPQRGIDETYTIMSQKTFFDDDTATEVDLDFEQEELERKARGEESLWSERAKLYPSETQDVGGQDFTGDTGSAPSDTNVVGGVIGNQSDTSVTGNVGFDEPSQVPANAQTIIKEGTGTSNVNLIGNVPFLETGSSGSVFHGGIIVEIEVGNFWNTGSASNGDITWDWFLLDSSNNTLDSGTVSTNEGQVSTVEFANSDLDEGDEWTVLLQTSDGVFSSVDIDRFFTYMRAEVYSYPIHKHDDDFDTDDNNHDHDDDLDSNDNQHGGSGDASGQHGASGSTDSKNVNIPDEVDVNRGG